MLDYFGKLNKNVIDQIKYRGTILTGEITKDNDDGTYDVKISQADEAYPNVETAFYGETFSVDEIVIVTFEDGNKERPRIWGHAKKIAQEPKIVEVDYSGGARVETLNAYSITVTTAYINGKISITGVIGNCTRRGFHYGTTTDYGSDVYEDGNFGEGTYNLQIVDLTPEETYHYQAFVLDANGDEQVGADKTFTTAPSLEYFYTMKFNDDELHKRNLSDLEIAETISLTSGHRYYYLCFDSDGYLYTYDKDYSGGAAFVKWDLESGVVASHIQGLASLSAWADWSLLGNNIACEYAVMWTIDIALNSDIVSWTLNDIPSGQAVGSASNGTYWYVLGENTADNKLIVEKYNSSKVLQSTIDISADYIGGGYCRYYNAIGAYPSGNIYVVYKKSSNSRFYLVKINSDDSITEITELDELYGYNLVRILTDINGNVYVLREYEATLTYTWYKYNSSGILQISKEMSGSSEMFGVMAPN